METVTIDIAEIGDLPGGVAMAGAIRGADANGDETFEYIVGIAAVIYELYPTA